MEDSKKIVALSDREIAYVTAASSSGTEPIWFWEDDIPWWGPMDKPQFDNL
ncbi:MAG: hypothetical protein AAF250_08975 [Pseudomonadota bacterium]